MGGGPPLCIFSKPFQGSEAPTCTSRLTCLSQPSGPCVPVLVVARLDTISEATDGLPTYLLIVANRLVSYCHERINIITAVHSLEMRWIASYNGATCDFCSCPLDRHLE